MNELDAARERVKQEHLAELKIRLRDAQACQARATELEAILRQIYGVDRFGTPIHERQLRANA